MEAVTIILSTFQTAEWNELPASPIKHSNGRNIPSIEKLMILNKSKLCSIVWFKESSVLLRLRRILFISLMSIVKLDKFGAMSVVVRLGDRSSHLYCTACLPDGLASHDWTGSMSRHQPSQNIKHRENISSDSPEPVWGWYTPHHFLVSTFWSQPPSGLSWLELFSIPSGQYGRIQQPTSNISHGPASIICPLCGAARTSKSLLSSHATASPRSRRPSHLRSVYYEGWREIIVLIDVIQKCSATQSWTQAPFKPSWWEGWS